MERGRFFLEPSGDAACNALSWPNGRLAILPRTEGMSSSLAPASVVLAPCSAADREATP
jgi:hypothetical protein